jgi:hypothetical protein
LESLARACGPATPHVGMTSTRVADPLALQRGLGAHSSDPAVRRGCGHFWCSSGAVCAGAVQGARLTRSFDLGRAKVDTQTSRCCNHRCYTGHVVVKLKQCVARAAARHPSDIGGSLARHSLVKRGGSKVKTLRASCQGLYHRAPRGRRPWRRSAVFRTVSHARVFVLAGLIRRAV